MTRESPGRRTGTAGDTPPGLQISKFNLKPGAAPGEQGRKDYGKNVIQIQK